MKKNEYGIFTAIAMVVGIVIGSGIFFKSDNILVATGGSVALGVLVFCIAATAIIFGSLTISELASRNTEAGGVIAYAENSYNKSVGCAFGWFQAFLYYPTIIAVVSWVAGIYICMLFGLDGGLSMEVGIGLAIVVVLFIFNSLSAKLGGYFQNGSTIIKLIPLIFIAIVGLAFGDASQISFSDVTTMQSVGWITAIAPIAFSYDGWIVATSIGHEIKDSRKNLPKALVVAPIIILLVYIIYFVGVCTYIGPEAVMQLGDGHVNLIANEILGPVGAKVILVFVIVSVVGTVNGLILGLIRLPYSLAIRDMFPKSETVSKLSDKNSMPVNSAIVAFILSIVWIVIHYFTTKFGVLVNSDISEISITVSYAMYILLYVKVFKLGRTGEVKGIFRGTINPILAIMGSLIILLGSIGNKLFWVYAILCSLVLLSAVLYWRNKSKQLKTNVDSDLKEAL